MRSQTIVVYSLLVIANRRFPMTETSTEILYLDPADIIADEKDNVRLSLKPSRVEQRKLSILEHGQQQPVHVELLAAPVKGKHYRMIAGYYRHAAISAINAETPTNAMTIAAIVSPVLTPVERYKMQVVENDREEASLMDTAIAVKRALDLGMSKSEVRALWSRPKGKKGEITPASNAWVNMMLGLLELPKGVQDRIHNGVLGLKAAYVLGKLPKESQQEVIEKAEAARQADEDREAAEEAKILKAESKAAEKASKLQTVLDKVAALKQEVIEARAVQTQRKQELAAVKAEETPEEPAAAKVAFERLKGAQSLAKAAQTAVKKAQNDLAKALKRKNDAEERAAAAPKPKKNRRVGKAKSKKSGISHDEISDAAKKAGVGGALKPMNLQEVKEMIYDLKKSKVNARVAAIGEAFDKCLKSELTTNQLVAELVRIVVGVSAKK